MMSDTAIAAKMLDLRAIFADTPTYLELQQQFEILLEARRAEISAGVTREARGIALIGASGSGKTTAMERLKRSTSGLVLSDANKTRCDFVSTPVPSPATLKFVGQTVLNAVGYQLRRDKPAYIIWDMVRDHLKTRQTLFLHLDEAQDIALNQTVREKQHVINTLKSLMQYGEWPVGLILSGMPFLKEMLNHDEQLARRFFPIEFPRLNPVTDMEQVLNTVAHYSMKASIPVATDAQTGDFSARLIHAADGEFGLTVELIIAAIEDALRRGSEALEVQFFANAFSRRSGCLDELNPFLAVDFDRINSRRILA